MCNLTCRNLKIKEKILDTLNNIYDQIKCIKIQNYSLKIYFKRKWMQKFMHFKTYFLNKL